MVRAVLALGSTSLHVTQIAAGFSLLADAGELEVEVHRRRCRPDQLGDPVVRAEVGGARIAFELRDGTDLSQEDLDWCTTYCKRSYRAAVHGDDARIVPLGLNYVVRAGGDWRARQAWWAFTGRRARSLGQLRGAASLAWQVGRRLPTVADFEAPPSTGGSPTAMLATRVWDPRRASGSKADEWEAMNEVRASCIRALADALGDRFTGGLASSDWARTRYPDLVLDDSVSARRAYLAQMRGTDVCVVTAGLRGSNGWRMAECLAASRAIACESMAHEVPGDLGDGRGLVTFAGPDECVAVVSALLADDDRRQELATAGQAYYRAYVRPDALVRRALELAT